MFARRLIVLAGAAALATAGINTWECDLVDTAPANEVWRGPSLRAGSNGTTVATGTCRPVTPYWAYYITVSYTNAGGARSATSDPFLCSNGPL